MCVLLRGSLQLLLIITQFESPRPMLFIYGEGQILECPLAPHIALYIIKTEVCH